MGCLESSVYVVNNVSSNDVGFISGLMHIAQQGKLVLYVIFSYI